jgi:hypothetical protein
VSCAENPTEIGCAGLHYVVSERKAQNGDVNASRI